MKPQDILFVLVLIGMLVFLRKKPKAFVIVGLGCFLLAIPLFQFWIFFTAQRLVMYGTAFILVAVILLLFELKKKKK